MHRQIRFVCGFLLFAFGPGGISAAEPQKVALLVGVNQYEKRGLAEYPLDYAEADVNALEVELSRPSHGFRCTKLVGRSATKSAVEGALRNLLGSGLPADAVVLVGLAGHGQQIETAGKEDAFYCPYDAVQNDGTTMLSLSDLMHTLDRRGGVNLVLVDACRDDPTRSVGKSRSITGNELEGRLPANTAVLFSCAARQQALETDKAGGGHGVFFHQVIEGIRGAAADTDGNVTWDSLVTYVRPRVNARAKEWFPDRAQAKADGALQTPHQLTNLVAIPILGRRTELQPLSLQTNSVGMKLVLISAGEFQMGSPASDTDARYTRYDVKPQRRVRITQPFYLGQTEVTQGQWESLMGTTPWKGKDFVQDGANYAASWISWDEATEYCRKLSQTEGKTYRLPTEAEWEYACRAGTTTKYSFGDDASRLGDYAWWGGFIGDGNAKSEQYAHPVAQKRPNPWGLCDMHGNVDEWCSDKYDYSDPTSPSSGTRRVHRGGCWFLTPAHCRSASRSWVAPDIGHGGLGFRVALVP